MGGGPGLSRLFARSNAGGQRTGADSYRTVFWESNEFWLSWKSKGGGGGTNAVKGGISYLFPFPTQCQDNLIFFFHFWRTKPSSPHLCLHLAFAYQRNPIGTCFAYLHLISNFKWTCQKWSSFLFWMCEDYLACIINASTCNAATKQNKLISNGARGTFYIAFH